MGRADRDLNDKTFRLRLKFAHEQFLQGLGLLSPPWAKPIPEHKPGAFTGTFFLSSLFGHSAVGLSFLPETNFGQVPEEPKKKTPFEQFLDDFFNQK